MFTVNFQTTNAGPLHSFRVFDSKLEAFEFLHTELYAKNYKAGVIIDSEGEIADRLVNLDLIHA
jgi:hypothetical protein